MNTVEVYDCERRARTLTAIKYIRQLRGLGLTEAISLVSEVYHGGRSITLEFNSVAEATAFVQHLESLGFSCRHIPDSDQ